MFVNVLVFYFGMLLNKFFDYIVVGLLVFNNYFGWLVEMIIMEDCGLVVLLGDVSVFVDVLEWVVDNWDMLKVMGWWVCGLVECDFDCVRLVDFWLYILEFVVLDGSVVFRFYESIRVE